MSSPSHSVFIPVRFEPQPLPIPSPNDSGSRPMTRCGERETMNQHNLSSPNGTDCIVPPGSAKPAPALQTNGIETAPLPVLGQGPTGPFQELNLAGLQTTSARVMDWIWKGYIGAGKVTLLISQWKSGKSTLMSVLLSKLGGQVVGGSMGGHAVSAGRALVVTEESKEAWHERSLILPLGDHVSWFCQPFLGKASYEDWQALLNQIGRIHEQRPIAALFIDSLANLSPMRSENEASEMLKSLLPLQRLTSRGIAVVVLHHPKKGPLLPGQMARGSGALSAFVDIIIEMKHVNRRDRNDRRRRLEAYSRHAETPPSWVMELSADGKDYLSLGPSAAPDFETGWPVLQQILDNSEGWMPREEILRHWPERTARPGKVTLWRWLNRLIREGQVLCEGDGSKRDPHQYCLPGMEMKWQERVIERLNRQFNLTPASKEE